MALTVKNIKGMPDILPGQTALWQYVESQLRAVLNAYAYQEIRMPVVEPTDLFKRSIGEVTDIVEKEMYTFADRNGDLMTLRPEGTAGCVRAVCQNGLVDNQAQQRLWYQGPMFRYERPQKGRQRQFHQLGVETFGIASADIDAELIIMAYRLWQKLGISDALTLEINSIGSQTSRQAFKEALVDYLTPLKDQLDEDSKRRLDTNPMRILDAKAPQTQALLVGAPALEDYLDEESKAHFTTLCSLLESQGIAYTINRQLVRGLDYYNKTVFEWTTEHLGAQATVCAGGRYDGLVEQLGGKPTAAVGFAIGLERLCLLLESLQAAPESLNSIDAYFVVAGDEHVSLQAFTLGEQIRNRYPNAKIHLHCGGGSLKSQMKKADKSGAKIAIILGSNELEQQMVTLKDLRQSQTEQSSVAFAALPSALSHWLKE